MRPALHWLAAGGLLLAGCVTSNPDLDGSSSAEAGADSGVTGQGPWPATGALCDGGAAEDAAADAADPRLSSPTCESDPDGYPTATGNAQCGDWAPQLGTTGVVHARCVLGTCWPVSECDPPSTSPPACSCGLAVAGCLFPMICKSDFPGAEPHCAMPCT